MEEWKTYTASEYCYKVADGTHDSPQRRETGRYLVTSKHIKGTSIDFENAYYISEDDYQKIIKRSKVDQWDVIISMIGEYCGFCYLEDSIFTDYAVKNVGLLKVGDELKSRWLYYYLNSPSGKAQLKQCRAGSTQPYISLGSLRNINIPTPPIQTMKRIVGILSSIDEKIELNNRINHNLEKQAQALYKSWFVDFEPFKDGKFVESELGMIPEDWRVMKLREVTTELRTKVGSKTDIKVLSPVNTGQLVLSEEYFTKQVYSESIAKYLIVEPYDFAYNPARINIGSIGQNEFEFTGCVSPVYVVFRCEEGYNHFFDLFRRTNTFKEEVISRSIGGVRQTLGYQDLSLIKVIYPPHNVVTAFNEVYSKIRLTQKHLFHETESLQQTRDSLLPRLMSGELTC